MAKLYNLARMTTATTLTGTITLGSAVSGYLTFALAGVANGETVSYGIKDGASSEVGTGVYTTSGTTLTRNVTKSTNSDSAISLSGTAEVFITQRAEDFVSDTPIESSVASGAGPTLTTAVAANITSIILPVSGLYLLWGNIGIAPGAGTLLTRAQGAIHSVTATIPTRPNGGAGLHTGDLTWGSSSEFLWPVGVKYIANSGSNTHYLNVTATFTSAAPGAYGYLAALRMRS